MHSYAWSCSACGNSNTASAEQCFACGCPARFTVAQLEHFRSEFLERGEPVLPAAADSRQTEDRSAFEVLLAPITIFLFGAFPADLVPSSKEGAMWLLLFAGPVLFIASYAVIQWATAGVGLGSSSRAALTSFAIAVVGFLFAAALLAIRAAKSRSL